MNEAVLCLDYEGMPRQNILKLTFAVSPFPIFHSPYYHMFYIEVIQRWSSGDPGQSTVTLSMRIVLPMSLIEVNS